MRKSARSVIPSLIKTVYLLVPFGACIGIYSTMALNCAVHGVRLFNTGVVSLKNRCFQGKNSQFA